MVSSPLPQPPNLKSALQEGSLLSLVLRHLQSRANRAVCDHPVPQVLSEVRGAWARQAGEELHSEEALKSLKDKPRRP